MAADLSPIWFWQESEKYPMFVYTGANPYNFIGWNHDDDRWLGIYVNRKEAREAYDRAMVWWSEEQKYMHYSKSKRVALFEYVAVDDRFREVERNELD